MRMYGNGWKDKLIDFWQDVGMPITVAFGIICFAIIVAFIISYAVQGEVYVNVVEPVKNRCECCGDRG